MDKNRPSVWGGGGYAEEPRLDSSKVGVVEFLTLLLY